MENLTDNSELIEAELVRNPPPATHILLAKGDLVSVIVNLEASIVCQDLVSLINYCVSLHLCSGLLVY